MNRSNPAEDFSQIKKQLRELDRQIPVPFAATAKGMKDRLTSPAAAKPFLSHKLAWSAASLLLVAFIGYVLWSPLSSLVATNDSSASNGVQIEAAQETFGTNGFHRMLCRRTTKRELKAPLLQRCVEHRTAMSAIFLKKIRFTIRQKTTDKFSWRSAQSLPLTAVSLPFLKAATPVFFPARTIPPLWRIKFISIP